MSDQITKRTTTTTVVHVGMPLALGTSPANNGTAWESVEVHFHGIEGLSLARDDEPVDSPTFTCLGRQWILTLCPGGDEDSIRGNVALFLCLRSGSNRIVLSYSLSVRNKDGVPVGQFCGTKMFDFAGEEDALWGDSDFAERSRLLSSLSDGALIVEVRMKQVGGDILVPPFIPDNPLSKNILKRFNKEETADVVFEVSSEREHGDGARKRAKTAAVTFYAHRSILLDSATTLAELVKSAENTSPIQITDVKHEIFHHMMHYVYGGEIPEEEMKSNAKDLIDAADKYGVVNLKLKAEAFYVEATELSVDNVIDILLYADSKNCALLKEVVMDYMVENGKDVLRTVSFEDVPGPMMKDLLTATTRREQKNSNGSADDNGYETMRVSTLRKKLHEKGLDIDGSREAMIALLKEHS